MCFLNHYSISSKCLVCPSYNTDFFVKDSGFILGEELGLQSPTPQAEKPLATQQGVSYLSEKDGSGELGEELDLSFLPDELGTHNDTGMTSLMMHCF